MCLLHEPFSTRPVSLQTGFPEVLLVTRTEEDFMGTIKN